MLLDCKSRVLKSIKTCELTRLRRLRAPKHTLNHHCHLAFKRSPVLKRSVILHIIRVVLPLGKYSPARNTTHQGVGNMKHPNYHCSAALQDSFGATSSNFQAFLSSFSCESRYFPHKFHCFHKDCCEGTFSAFFIKCTHSPCNTTKRYPTVNHVILYF